MTSLFPAALIGVSLLSAFGEASLAREAADYLVDKGADEATATVVRQSLDRLLQASSGAIGLTLVASILVGLYGASQAFSARGGPSTSSTRCRSSAGRAPAGADIGTTLLVIVLFTVVLVSLFLGGGVAQELWGEVGLGDTAAAVWSVARWVRRPGLRARRLRDHLRLRAGHHPPPSALDHPGSGGRGAHLDPRVDRARGVRAELLDLRRLLRRVRRGDHPAAVDLPGGERVPVRRRAQRRDRARRQGGPRGPGSVAARRRPSARPGSAPGR
jgi:hypothetical protein